MKIIEAMKKIKDLQVKADDLRSKIKTYCADQSHETPVYGADQKAKVDGWLQSHSDVLKEILHLRVSVQRTNLLTKVDINIEGVVVTKTIAEWIHRRRDLSNLEMSAWGGLTDRGLKEGVILTSTGEKQEVKIRRYYDPSTRDNMIAKFRSEPNIIDRTLEVVNAVTDLIEK